jgi:hypothetical protein
MRSRRVRWEGYVARKGKMIKSLKYFVENGKRRHLGDVGLDEVIILKLMLKK